MKQSEKRTFEAILKHKHYFDERLIEFVVNAEKIISSLKMDIADLKDQNTSLRHDLSLANNRIKAKEKEVQRIRKFSESKSNEIDELLERLKHLEEEMKKDRKIIEEKSKQVDELIKKNDELTKKINRKIKRLQSSNSTNSNMPTTYDVLTHTKAKADANTRRKSNRKRGGQEGHPVHKSELFNNADEILIIDVKEAPKGAVKRKDDEGKTYYATQEIDLILKSKITETRYYIHEEGITLNENIMRKYAINCVTYAPHFKSSIIYLNQKGTIPLQRLCDITSEISKGEINLRPSTIVKWNNEFHYRSFNAREEILESVLADEKTNVDETGMKIYGKTAWFHVITNDKGSYFVVTNKRGDGENGPIALLAEYEGIVIHDHFKKYGQLKKCTHAECNAHIERYLKCGIDVDENEECRQMLELLHKMLSRKIELIQNGKNKIDGEELKKFEEEYLMIARKGLKKYYDENPNIEKKYEPEFIPTFKRMIEYKEEHLRFLKDFRVPYTNNAAERQCRVVKAKKKASGQFVSFAGAQAYADILTIMQTSKARNENTLANIENIFS